MSRNEIKKNASAKEVKSHLASLEGEIEAEELILQKRLQEIENKKKIKKSLQKKAKKLETPKGKVVLSEHGFSRYCQRVKGINFEDVEKEMVTEDLLKILETLPNSGTFPHKNGYKMVIKNGIITTILIGNE